MGSFFNLIVVINVDLKGQIKECSHNIFMAWDRSEESENK